MKENNNIKAVECPVKIDRRKHPLHDEDDVICTAHNKEFEISKEEKVRLVKYMLFSGNEYPACVGEENCEDFKNYQKTGKLP